MAGIVLIAGMHWIWLVLLLLLSAFSLYAVKTPKALVGTVFSFALGIASGHLHFQRPMMLNASDKPFTVAGTIEQISERYTFAPQQEIVINQGAQSVKLLLDVPAPVLIGDTIIVSNVVPRRQNTTYATPTVKRTYSLPTYKARRAHITLVNRPERHLRRDIAQLHHTVLHSLQEQLDPDAFTLFCLMFLGKVEEQQAFQLEDHKTFIEKLNSPAFQNRRWFNNWGISHYLARSGLHLVIVVILLQFMLGFLPIPHLGKKLFLGGYLALYSLISWPAISFTRALLMVALALGADFANRPTQAVHLVTIATYIVLLLQPANLFYADFQLSFGLTFALAWANNVHRQRKRLHKWQTIALE